jgi:hypothetical protein
VAALTTAGDAVTTGVGYNRGKEDPMITITARFDGRVFVPTEPLDLPPGYELEITIPSPPPAQPEQPTLLALAELMKQFPENPDWPPDGAVQHDHYLYGTPKKP